MEKQLPINDDGKVLSSAGHDPLKPEQVNPPLQNQQSGRPEGIDVFYDPEEVASGQQQGGEGDVDFDPNNIQVDERFANLDKTEAIMRTLQSKTDILRKTNEQYKQKMSQLENNVALLQTIAQDKNFARTFLSKYHQDLVPQIDPYDEAQNILKQEFGEDFEPDEADSKRNPFGKNGRYFDRVNELYKQIKEKKTEGFESLDEMIQRQQDAEMREQQAFGQEVAQLKSKYKVDDNVINHVVNWGQKLSFTDLFNMWRYAMQNVQGNFNRQGNVGSARNVVSSGMGNSAGGGNKAPSGKQLATIFGPPGN